jgi:hypothetical protein
MSWSDWTVPGIFFHAYQFQAEVAKSVKDAVKVGLIPDLADEGALLAARSQGKPLQCGRKTSGEASPDYDPVPGRLHVTPGVLWVGAHLEPKPDDRSSPVDRVHPGGQLAGDGAPRPLVVLSTGHSGGRGAMIGRSCGHRLGRR